MSDQTTPATAMTREKLEDLRKASPFQRLLGLKLEAYEAGAETLTLRAVHAEHLERSLRSGQYHGGVIASLIDIAGDFALGRGCYSTRAG